MLVSGLLGSTHLPRQGLASSKLQFCYFFEGLCFNRHVRLRRVAIRQLSWPGGEGPLLEGSIGGSAGTGSHLGLHLRHRGRRRRAGGRGRSRTEAKAPGSPGQGQQHYPDAQASLFGQCQGDCVRRRDAPGGSQAPSGGDWWRGPRVPVRRMPWPRRESRLTLSSESSTTASLAVAPSRSA